MSDKAFNEELSNELAFHPKGARLTRDEAIQLGARAFARQGFRAEDLVDGGAFYMGPGRGLLGVRHKLWFMSFTNRSPGSVVQYPTVSVYVDDRNGKTEIIEKAARP